MQKFAAPSRVCRKNSSSGYFVHQLSTQYCSASRTANSSNRPLELTLLPDVPTILAASTSLSALHDPLFTDSLFFAVLEAERISLFSFRWFLYRIIGLFSNYREKLVRKFLLKVLAWIHCFRLCIVMLRLVHVYPNLLLRKRSDVCNADAQTFLKLEDCWSRALKSLHFTESSAWVDVLICSWRPDVLHTLIPAAKYRTEEYNFHS